MLQLQMYYLKKHPDAYKDVDEVIELTQKAGLARPVVRMKPNHASRQKYATMWLSRDIDLIGNEEVASSNLANFHVVKG